MTTYAGKYRSAGFRPRDVAATAVVTKPYTRPTERPASLGAADTTYAPKPTPDTYSGTACIGIAAMHKSNLVPVFTPAQAVDAATMRRG
jgi:hypothetical protein